MRRRSLILLAAPAIVTTGALVGAPLLLIVCYSLWRADGYDVLADWNIDNYVEVATRYIWVLAHTLNVGLLVATICTLAAFPLAYAIRFKMGRLQDTILFLLLVAMFSGYLVRIYAWRLILGDHGLLNSALIWLGIVEEPVTIFLYSMVGLVITQVGFLLPIAVLPIYSALQNIPLDRLQAAHDLGAGKVETTWRVVLPETSLGIAVSFSICLIFAAGDFVTPTLVGGPSGLMVGQAVLRQFGSAYNWPLGSALAAVAIFALGLLVAIAFAIASHWQHRLVNRVPTHAR